MREAMDLSLRNRLRTFIVNEESEPLALFGPEFRSRNNSGDWYGEHVGKWLVAASKAAARTSDTALRAQVRHVADFILSNQEPSGYLGTYAPTSDARLDSDKAVEVRTWDVWVHATLILGLVEVACWTGESRYTDCALRISRFIEYSAKELARLGNHEGLSAAILIDPLVELHLASGDPQPLKLARLTLTAIDDRLQLIPNLRAGMDVAEVGTGKIYQICWLLVGLTKLYRVTKDTDLLTAVRNAWNSIRLNHLTPMGGPWGGVATHKEVFNRQGFFSPDGMVETCNTMAWMQLNRELLLLTGEAKYAEEYEKAMYNSLLGAIDENGADWSYFTFPNGRRNSTYFWACCKSSGALALEELGRAVVTQINGGISVNTIIPLHVSEVLTMKVGTDFEEAEIVVHGLEGELRLRMPTWAKEFSLTRDGRMIKQANASGYAILSGPFRADERIQIRFGPRLEVLSQSATTEHHGQEIARTDYFAVSHGPLVYATSLLDGYKQSETLKLPTINPTGHFSRVEGGFDLNLPARKPIRFSPYFEAGGRTDGKWRAVWHEVAWQ